jgi:divalent metal cation (Fe/Co/Zn/Cd) transporter
VAVFIGHPCWQIARDASGVLADQIVIAEEDIRSVVESTAGVIGCEKIRTRGLANPKSQAPNPKLKISRPQAQRDSAL